MAMDRYVPKHDKKQYKGDLLVKKMISVMLVVGMMLCLGGCNETTSNPMADMYYDDEQLGSYYSDYEMTECTQQIFGDRISGTYRGFNGMVALWIYEDDGGFPVDVKYSMNVLQGKVKLILYYTDGRSASVETIEEFNENYVSDKMVASPIVLRDGLSCVKLVGTDDAEVTFEIEIKNGSFIGTVQ